MSGRNIVLFSRTYSGYGDQFLLDQHLAMPEADLVVYEWAASDPKPNRVTEVPKAPRALAAIDARVGHLWPGPDGLATSPIRWFHTRRRLGQARVVFTLFAWDAIAVMPALRPSTKLVVYCAGTDVNAHASRGPGYTAGLRLALERAAQVMCGSEFMRAQVAALGVNADAIAIHSLGVDVPTKPPVRSVSKDRVTLLAASRLEPVKGVDQTVRSVGVLVDRGYNVRLVVLGDGSQRCALDDLIIELGLEKVVELRGRVSRDEVRSEMLVADIFVQHNVAIPDGPNEALGGSLLEASACGLPVIATRTGGVGEAVLDEVTGLLSNPTDIIGMAHNIQRLITDHDLRRQLGSAGHEYVLESHNGATQRNRLRERLLEIAREE